MGKIVGAVAGGLIQDRSIRSGVKKGRAGYSDAIGTLTAGKEQALNYLQPYADLGQATVSPLSTLLLGKSYDPETGKFLDVNPEDRLSSFYESPDYQFRLQEGQRALEASQAARGGLLSGRAMLEAQRFGQGEASSEYGNYL